ncbi:MAG: type II secretion system protein GspD [Planctomycetota bacterium]
MRRVLAAILLLPILVAQSRGQAQSLDARVNLRVADQSLEDVVAHLRERSGANIVVIDPSAEEQVSKVKVSIDLTDVPWRDALDVVAEKALCVVEERTAGLLAVTRPKKVTFMFADQDIRSVIDAIAKVSGANIIVGPEVVGNVSVRLTDVPWRDALYVVAKTLNFTVVEENRGLLRIVDPRTLQDQLETRTYQLRYIRPKSVYKPNIKSEFLQAVPKTAATPDVMKTFTVLQALGKALSPAGQIDYIDLQNVVIVRDTSQVHDSIREMLNRLDIEPAQVFCDVKFVSTSNTDLLNLGVDYGDGGPQVSLSGGSIPITFPFNEGGGGFEDWLILNSSGVGPFADPALNAGGAAIIPTTTFGALSFTQFQATLRMLQRDSNSEVIQAPKIIALDGNEATIFVGETIRYAEAKSEQGQAGGLQLSVAEAGGSPVEIGFQLLIRPNVIPGTSNIVMEIIPKETSLSGTGTSTLAPPGFDVFTIGAAGLEGSIALPRTRASTIVTTMMLESGETAMIGGLSTDQTVETNSAVPFLSKIPLLGALFKHEVQSRERRSLMVFITPTIAHSSADTQMLLQQELRRRRQSLKEEWETLISTAEGASAAVPQ